MNIKKTHPSNCDKTLLVLLFVLLCPTLFSSIICVSVHSARGKHHRNSQQHQHHLNNPYKSYSPNVLHSYNYNSKKSTVSSYEGNKEFNDIYSSEKHDNERSHSSEDNVRRQLLKDMGLKKLPDTSHVSLYSVFAHFLIN